MLKKKLLQNLNMVGFLFSFTQAVNAFFSILAHDYPHNSLSLCGHFFTRDFIRLVSLHVKESPILGKIHVTWPIYKFLFAIYLR